MDVAAGMWTEHYITITCLEINSATHPLSYC